MNHFELSGGLPLPLLGFSSSTSMLYPWLRSCLTCLKIISLVQCNLVKEEKIHVIHKNLTFAISSISISLGALLYNLVNYFGQVIG